MVREESAKERIFFGTTEEKGWAKGMFVRLQTRRKLWTDTVHFLRDAYVHGGLHRTSQSLRGMDCLNTIE